MTLIDTLSWARARLPERHFAGGYGLKDLARDRLQVDNPVGFKEVTSHPIRRVKVKTKTGKVCSCGVEGCKKKTRKVTKKNPTPEAHDKTTHTIVWLEWKVLKKRAEIPLTDLTWERGQLPHCCLGEPWPLFTERTGLVCWACQWAALVEYAGNDALWALRLAREVLSKEGFAYGHDRASPEDLPPRPRR